MPLLLPFLLLAAAAPPFSSASCFSGCPLALGSYYISNRSDIGISLTLTFISSLFNTTYPQVLLYNKDTITNQDLILVGNRVNVFFPCDCLSGEYLAANFAYRTRSGDSYDRIASNVYANLTSADWLAAVNIYPSTFLPIGVYINVTINCSCGDPSVSRDYGLFETYPLRAGESLKSVAAKFNLLSEQGLLQSYNPGVDFSKGQGIVFIPSKDPNGSYLPLQQHKAGISGGAIGGIVLSGVVLLGLAIWFYFGIYKKRSVSLLLSKSEGQSTSYDHDIVPASDKTSVPLVTIASAYTGDRSVEFSYEELATATDEFSMANKIGEGGFGVVYYADLKGKKAAIKKMDMQSTKEFLAELKVLTRVHHINLVHLIGYCTEGSLFLVYEYIDNGNLSQHLRGPYKDPLSWSSRVQIALDSARALEYIHEHTVPVYIHRDIKSANILIDKNFHAKVADFGLTKLAKVGNTQTRAVGTFGYMPPEYQYGEVSPKADVFAFGVILYELISAKEAVVTVPSGKSKALVAIFEKSLKNPDQKEELQKLVDPRLSDDYPLESIYKMAQLAKACTQEDPQLRPAMRSVVVALRMLSSTSIVEWDISSYCETNHL